MKAAEAFVTLRPQLDASAVEKELNKLDAAGDQHAKKITGSFKGAAVAIGGAFVAAGATKFLSGAIDEAREAQKVTAQTEAVIRSTGQAAGLTAKDFSDLAGAISKKVGIDDEQIQAGENVLATFTNIRNEVGKGNDVFSQATKLATDMSVALGQDMKSSAIQLGKALNDPIKGVTALQRVGVSFTEQQKEQIKTLVESGNTMGAQKLILAELAKEFGGSAEKQATAADKARVSIGNLEESVGTALIPVLDGGAKSISFLADGFASLPGPVQTGTIALTGVAGVAVVAAKGLETIHGVSDTLTKQFPSLANSAGIVKAGFAALGAAGIAYELISIGNAASKTKIEVSDLGKRSDAELYKVWQTTIKFSDAFGGAKTRMEFFRQAGEQGVGTLERLRDVMKAHGDNTKEVDAAIAEQIRGQKQLNEDQKRGAEVTDNLNHSTATIADTVGYLTAAFEKNKQAIDDRYQALHKGLDANLDYEDSIDKLEESLKSNTGTLDIHTQAGRDNIRAARDAQDAIFALTKQTFDNTGSVEDAIRAGDLYTANLANQLTQAGFTQAQVKQLIDTIALTPAQKETIFSTPGLDEALSKTGNLAGILDRINSHSDVLFQGTGGGPVRFHASGGSLDEGLNIINEGGPELLNKRGSRVDVMTAGQTRQLVGAGVGGGFHATIHVTPPPGTNPRRYGVAVADGLREMAWNNWGIG